MKKKVKYLIIIIIVIFMILIYFLSQLKNSQYGEDIIFFKLFSNSRQQKQNNEMKIYKFKFDSKNKKHISRNINLIETSRIK